MKKFWEFPEEHRRILVESRLGVHGKVIGSLETPYSIIYTLERDAVPRYVVAKAPKVDAAMPVDQIEVRLLRFLHEANHLYRTCNLSLIQRFSHVEVAFGLPFLISVKRDMTLRDAMETRPIPIVSALAVAIQVSHAIGYIGRKGIDAHQDLKAENIFVDFLGKKFAFGDTQPPFLYQAYVADLDMANAAVLFNKPQGSRPYMAPEQYKKLSLGEPRHDLSKADVFAIGVNLFEMISGGIHPIGERTTDVWPNGQGKWSHEEVWKKWARSAVDRLNENTCTLEADLKAVLLTCFQTDVTSRTDAIQLEAALLECLRVRDDSAYYSLVAYIAQVDEAETINSNAGWPYMDDMYDRLRNELA